MKKRLAIAALAVLLLGICCLIYVFPPTLRHEHLYRGRPSSYWAHELRRWFDNPTAWSPDWSERSLSLVSGGPTNTSEPAILVLDASAVPVLVDLLHADDAEVRDLAARFVSVYLRRHPSKHLERDMVISALIEAARDEDLLVAQGVRRALVTDLVPLPKEAVPALLEALKDDSMSIGARFALERVGPEAVPALADALEDPEPRVRRGAAAALGGLGPAAREVMPALRRLLDDNDNGVRLEAEKSLKLVETK
jgi:HEAT repeat protein